MMSERFSTGLVCVPLVNSMSLKGWPHLQQADEGGRNTGSGHGGAARRAAGSQHRQGTC